MENDYGLLNIIKCYEDYDCKTSSDIKDKNCNTYENVESENSEAPEVKDSIMFSNRIIQSSFYKIQIFKKILVIQDKKILSINFLKWKKITIFQKLKSPHDEDTITSDIKILKSLNIKRENDYLLKNRKIIEDFCNSEISDVDDHLKAANVNLIYNYELPLKNTKANNYDDSVKFKIEDKSKLASEFPYNYENDYSGKIISFSFALRQILRNIFHKLIFKCESYIYSKKSANTSLSLLFIFTQLAVSKKKLQKANNSNKIDDLKILLSDNEKKIVKYESCLNEKAQIIESRNDRIEQQIETIDLLTEEINRLNEKIDKLEKKGKNLNVIQGKNKQNLKIFREFMPSMWKLIRRIFCLECVSNTQKIQLL